MSPSVRFLVRACTRPTDLDSRQTLAAHLCLAAALFLAAIPILVIELPPLFDYPSHLARVHMLLEWDRTPAFQAYFVPDSFLLPNVLSDLFMLAVARHAGVEIAGRVLLLVTLALTLTGTYALGRVLSGRYSVWPVFAAALLYNEMFFWGFLNYNLGLALLPWALAAWLHFADRPALRLAVGTLASLAIFFAHLVAFALYAVALLVLEFARAPAARGRVRRLALAGVQFLPAAAVYILASPTHDLALAPYFDFAATAKLGPFTRLLSSGNPIADCALLIALVGVAVAGRAAGWLRFHPALLAVAGAFLGLVLILPFSAKGSYFLDTRIAIAIALILAAAAMPAPRGTAVPALAALVLLALVGSRSYVLTADWKAQEAQYAALVRAFKALPPGSLLVPAAAHEFEAGDWLSTRHLKPAHEHTASYAVIERQVIVPNVFARRGQNPLVFDPAVEEMKPLGANPIRRVLSEEDLRDLVEQTARAGENHDAIRPPIPGAYVLVYQLGCGDWPSDLEVRPTACGDDFSLMEVMPGTGSNAIANAATSSGIEAPAAPRATH